MGVCAHLGLVSAACMVMAAAGDPELDVLISATDFRGGSVTRVEGKGWADGAPIIQSQEHYPDWAEWEFGVDRAGMYEVYAKYAAAQSRPVALSVDGTVLLDSVAGQVTGAWKSSTARWFSEGVVLLGEGRHVLRMSRPTCIPHICAWGLAYRGTAGLDKSVLDIDQRFWVRDRFPIQDWMIWTIAGTQDYEVRQGAYRIKNGANHYNRPLYGLSGQYFVFGGDRPEIMLVRAPNVKLGILVFELIASEGSKWLHECEEIDFAYDGAGIRWSVGDSLLGEGRISLHIVCLDVRPGFIVKLEADGPARLRAWYGGVNEQFHANRAGHGGFPGGRYESDVSGDLVKVGKDGALVRCEQSGAQSFATSSPASAWTSEDCAGGKAARTTLDLSTDSTYVAVALDGDEARKAIADSSATFSRSLKHYGAVSQRLSVGTPSAVLDAAVKCNNMSMDGYWQPPSFMHGVLRWGHECGGWYLGWRGWYGPIVAGDWERVAEAARFHCSRQLTAPDSGLHSRGKLPNFIYFDGRPKKAGYNMTEVFLDHLRSYYWWTGDRELVRELWPNIKLALEHQRRECGKNLDDLYTNAVNTWISDGHHYNGCACTQASAYAVSHNLFAAQVAELADDDPAFYREHAESVRQEMNRRLWMPRRGYFAEYVDEDGILHDAAEAPTIYHSTEFGAADAFQAYEMTRYVDRRLWRFGDQILANDWFPVIVTNGLIGFNESLNTSLAYFIAGRQEEGWRLLRVCVDSMRKATVPGSISCYGSRKGEQGTYVDFADASSMLARTVVEGLFGLQPRVDAGHVEWTPRFPAEWDHAELNARGFRVSFSSHGMHREYRLESDKALRHSLRIPAPFGKLKSLKLDGRQIDAQTVTTLLRPTLLVETGRTRKSVVEVEFEGQPACLEHPAVLAKGEPFVLRVLNGRIEGLHDPQGVLSDPQSNASELKSASALDDGSHTFFVKVQTDAGRCWLPADVECRPGLEILSAGLAVCTPLPDRAALVLRLRNNARMSLAGEASVAACGNEWSERLSIAAGAEAELRLPFPERVCLTPGHTRATLTVRNTSRSLWTGAAPGSELAAREMRFSADAVLWNLLRATPKRKGSFEGECIHLEFERNDRLSEIFTRKHDVDDPPELNNWTWYKTDCINTDAMRARARNGVLSTRVGVSFAIETSKEKNDGLYLSRWNPFPETGVVPVGARCDKLYLLLANHVHNSQTHMTQARVELRYTDGSRESTPLCGPKDIDGMLQHYSENAPVWIGGREGGWYGHGRASGVHADIVDVIVDSAKVLESFELRCLTRETLIGLLGATAHTVGQDDGSR